MSEEKTVLIDTEKYIKDVDINPTDLDTAMIKQAALYAHYGVLHMRAIKTEANSKALLEITEAKIDKEIRDKAAEDGRKLTEAMIDKEIMRDPRYVKALAAYNDAKAMAALSATCLEAFKQRRDMLIQLGANAREEMKGEVTIKARDAALNSVRELRARGAL